MSDDPVARLAKRYSEDAEGYERHFAPVMRPLGVRLLERLPLRAARRMVDVGGGVGVLLPEIRRLARGALVVGVDRAEGMVARMPREFPRSVMDAASPGFRSGIFDVATMVFMLFHLPDPVAGLREVRRILRPGGSIGVATWLPTGVESYRAYDVWVEELEAHGASWSDPSPARHDVTDSPDKVAGLLRAAGFRAIETTILTYPDPMDLEEFLTRRTSLGFSRRRFESLDDEARPACLRTVRRRLEQLAPEDFVDPQDAILAWARS